MGHSATSFVVPTGRLPIRPDTWRNAEDPGLRLGMRLCPTIRPRRNDHWPRASASVFCNEKLALVDATLQPGMTVSAAARQHGVSPSLLFKWGN